MRAIEMTAAAGGPEVLRLELGDEERTSVVMPIHCAVNTGLLQLRLRRFHRRPSSRPICIRK
jgi:hypothetical protein